MKIEVLDQSANKHVLSFLHQNMIMLLHKIQGSYWEGLRRI